MLSHRMDPALLCALTITFDANSRGSRATIGALDISDTSDSDAMSARQARAARREEREAARAARREERESRRAAKLVGEPAASPRPSVLTEAGEVWFLPSPRQALTYLASGNLAALPGWVLPGDVPGVREWQAGILCRRVARFASGEAPRPTVRRTYGPARPTAPNGAHHARAIEHAENLKRGWRADEASWRAGTEPSAALLATIGAARAGLATHAPVVQATQDARREASALAGVFAREVERAETAFVAMPRTSRLGGKASPLPYALPSARAELLASITALGSVAAGCPHAPASPEAGAWLANARAVLDACGSWRARHA